MARCENCGKTLRQKLADSHDADAMYDLTYFPESESGEPIRSVPRNYYCSIECVVEGVRKGQPKQATEEKLKRRKELMDDE